MSKHSIIHNKNTDKIIKAEKRITEYMYNDNNTYVHFEYNDIINPETNEDQCHLSVLTCNEKHDRVFLFKEFVADNKVDAIEGALYYLRKEMGKEMLYNVLWYVNNDPKKEVKISYFRGVDTSDVRSKFYCNEENISDLKIIQIAPLQISMGALRVQTLQEVGDS